MAQSDTESLPPPFIVGNVKNSSCRFVSSSFAPPIHEVASQHSNGVLQKESNGTVDYPKVSANNGEDEEEMPIMVLDRPSAEEQVQNCGSLPSPPSMGNYSSGFSETTSVPGCQPRAPPPPPPTPPPRPSAPHSSRLRPSSSSTSRKGFKCVNRGQIHVPKEHVDRYDSLFSEGYRADVSIHTEDGGVIAAHSLVLANASPAFRSIVEGEVSWPCYIPMSGVPYNAAKVFVRFLYSAQYGEREMEDFVMQLLVLAHTYRVPSLKRICTQEFEQGLLTKENVVDVLQMARLCDAPRLHLLCYRMIVHNAFKEVARTEGWKVMCASNPDLEQELVEAVIESNNRSQEKAKKMEEDKIYEQLHDAMEALVHICRDGCHTIGPQDKAFDPQKPRTCNYPACKGLESLVRHFAGCKLKVSGGGLQANVAASSVTFSELSRTLLQSPPLWTFQEKDGAAPQ
ncbi:unnamed protein product [Calypogeia fissa]